MTEWEQLRRVVLVHGAAHGAWCWEAVVPLLEARGYAVTAPDLPGLGDDLTPPKDVTLASYIERVVEAVEAGPTPVLLVGHSMGGMPISGAAEAIPDKIGKLVYLTAVLPTDGDTMLSIGVSSDDSAVRGMRPSAIEGAHDFDPALAGEIFYNTCPAADAARATSRLKPQADGPIQIPIALSVARWGRIPKTYIVCARDRAIPPADQHRLCERVPGVKKRVMDTDHSPFYSNPAGLAAILDEEARGIGG